MSYEIRDGSPADAETIAAYHHQCRLKAFAQILPAGALDGYPADGSLERWKQWLNEESEFRIQVIEHSGEAVAHVVVLENEIVHLFVDPDHWGQGLGRRLLGVGELMLSDAGHSQFILHTMVGNTPAINLYESTGWVVTEELKEEQINGVTYYEHLLSKDLRPPK